MRLPIVFLALALSAFAADAPDEPQASASGAAAPAPKLNGWVISGLVDGYITGNNNHPDSNLNQLYNFNIMYGQPLLSLAKITLDKSDSVVGVHADIGFGETMRLIHATDPAAIDHKALRYFEQMYVIIKPKQLGGMEFDYGQFVTSAGAEVIEAAPNWNYSRSILFAWALPYYHFGLRMNMPVTKSLTVGVQLVNPWNQVWNDEHKMSNLGLTMAYTGSKASFFMNYYTGPNNPGTVTGKRNLVDMTTTINPTDKLSMYLNFDWGSNGKPGPKLGRSDTWYGLATDFRYQLSKRFAGIYRVEYFKDRNGFSTGKAQALWENTITAEYKHNDHFISRFEYRYDSSDALFYDKEKLPGSVKSLSTVTLGVMVPFSWK